MLCHGFVVTSGPHKFTHMALAGKTCLRTLLCCATMMSIVTSAPTFPDFTKEEVKRRSQHLAYNTAWYQEWSGDQTTHPMLQNLVTVPNAIVKMLPLEVQELLGCANGQSLQVIRNWSFYMYCHICTVRSGRVWG